MVLKKPLWAGTICIFHFRMHASVEVKKLRVQFDFEEFSWRLTQQLCPDLAALYTQHLGTSKALALKWTIKDLWVSPSPLSLSPTGSFLFSLSLSSSLLLNDSHRCLIRLVPADKQYEDERHFWGASSVLQRTGHIDEQLLERNALDALCCAVLSWASLPAPAPAPLCRLNS